LAIDVCRATADEAFRRDWGLRDQLRRAAISVPSNIAEGNERGSDRDAVRFFFFARGSLAELATQADIAAELGMLQTERGRPWMQECDELGKMLTRLIQARRHKRDL
jgi:four helix bundle protein